MNKIIIVISLIYFLFSCSLQQNNSYYKGVKFIERISDLIEKKFDLYLDLYTINNEKSNSEKINDFYLTFGSYKKLNSDEGRKLLIQCVEYILYLINQDENIQKYLNDFPFPHTNLEIYISFIDEKGDEINDGNLSYCFIHQGNVVLCTLHEENDTKKRIKETYDESVKIINTLSFTNSLYE